MKWINKYELASFRTLLLGAHFNPHVILNTFIAEKQVNYDIFLKIYKRYSKKKEMSGYIKYFDLPSNLARAFFYARLLNLHKLKNKKILDLGTGVGYFPYAVNFLGHDCVALDKNENKVYSSLRNLLNVNTINETIRPLRFIKIKEGLKFDLITSFQTLYDIYEEQMWNEESWNFFIGMLRKNFLKANGKIFLQMNTIYQKHLTQYKKNIKTFERLGAKKLRRDGEYIFSY